MKTTKSLVIVLCFFHCLNNSITFGQTFHSCDATSSSASISSSVSSCSRTSTSWSNIYKKVATYQPKTNSPVKILGVNFIIFQDNSGGNNFQNNITDNLRLQNIFNALKWVFNGNYPASDPIAGVIDLPHKFIDFELKGIFYYTSSLFNTSTDGSAMLTYLSQNDPERLKYLNIFLTSGNGYAHASRGEFFSQSDNLFINMRGMYGAPGSDWAGSILMGHEMCHVLDLCHTYLGGGCATTLAAMGTNPEDGDYFDDIFGTPYPGNAPHLLPNPPTYPWGYDVTISTTDRMTNNLLGGFQAAQNLSPLQIGKTHRALALKTARRYLVNCVYDINNPWTISGNEDWDFDIQWDKDITIQSGAIVNLMCKLSMPQSSSIIIEAGGVLNIDGIVTNNCDNGWNGTIHIKPGGILNLKANADITFIGNGKILIDDDASNPGLLTIEGTPKVYLNGNNTMIDIRGMVDIKNSSTFTFFKQNNSSTHGYVRFANSSLSPSQNITAGTNSNIHFAGSSQSKKILQIDQETFYAPASIEDFILSSGKVELASGSRIQADGLATDINFFNVKFTGTTQGVNNAHRGLHLYGQPDVLIESCTFENGETGIFAALTSGGAPLTLSQCIFRNNNFGILANDKGINLIQCYFYENTFGVEAKFMTFPSYTLNGTTRGNDKGINYRGYSFAPLNVEDPNIVGNGIGLEVRGVRCSTRCGSVSFNEIGFNMLMSSTLVMNNSFDQNTASAEVTAQSNNTTIQASVARTLYLSNGNNNLTPLVPLNESVVNGSFFGHSTGIIVANSNQWNNSGSFSTDDYEIVDFLGNPLSIDDPNPLLSSNPCGQAIDQCPEPPCNIESITDYEYEELLWSGFEGFALKEELEIPLDKFNELENIDYREMFNSYVEGLMDYQNSSLTEEEREALHLNYQYMLEALGNAFKYNQITRNDNSVNLCYEINSTIEIQDLIMEYADNQEDELTYFITGLEKIQTYRLADRRDLAIPVFEELYNLDWEDNEKEMLDEFICVVEIEEQMITGEREVNGAESIYELLAACSGSELRVSKPNNTNQFNPINDFQLTIMPNPVSSNLTISANVEHYTARIINPMGQTLFYDKINFTRVIDVSSLPRGIYFLTIQAAEIKENRTIAVQ